KVAATSHFDIHYYHDSARWVDYAAEVLEKAYSSVTVDLNEPFKGKRSFFLYATVNDMEQSNIADIGDGVGGVTEMFKDRFMVYADGSKAWLENVITHEFTHEVQFSILLQGFWKSARIIKTYVYPLWMMEGIAEYETGDMDAEIENLYVRDAATSGGLISLVNLHNFAHLKPHQITMAYKEGGAAIRFLASEYGRDKVEKILRLFKSRYEVNSVLNTMIGMDIFSFDRKFREYMELKYARQVEEEGLREPERYGERLTSGETRIPEFNTSPAVSGDGAKMAWISTREGHPPVIFIRDMKTGRESKISGFDVYAENIPTGRFTQLERNLSLSPDGGMLVFSGQRNHSEYIYLHNFKTGRTRRLAIPGLAGTAQPSFSANGEKIVFVGTKRGLTDLYILTLGTSVLEGRVTEKDVQRVTDDPDDDSSPAFSPDGQTIAYSCEVMTSSGPQRDICASGVSGGARRAFAGLPGNERDPAWSPDGKKLLFTGDGQGVFELYEKDLDSGKMTRLTRTIGGNFTPAWSADGKEIFFASFRRGSVNIYRGPHEAFAGEEVFPADHGEEKEPESRAAAEPLAFRPYRFGASTDLFFPAVFFSSLGGFFWTNYWQASDNLGNHQTSLLLSYNSGYKYLNYQWGYSYSRFRPQFIFQTTGVVYDKNLSPTDIDYNRNYHRQMAAVLYPLDRYRRLEFAALNKSEIYDYPQWGLRENYQTKAGQVAFTADTVNGRYLVATRGSRFRVSFLKAVDAFGGNQIFDTKAVEAHHYIPIAEQGALAFRILGAESHGRDRQIFDLGGVGGVRGFQMDTAPNSASRLAIGTAELRFPVFQDINYYMWYFFPDFYFKALFGKIFVDSALGWGSSSRLDKARIGDVKNSVGFGVQVHTFVMQAFPFVLTFDYAWKTNNGGRVLYFYMGPLF
ncbi:MAG: peptidase MA family metallohydrolase, partial [bacterium]